MNLQSREHQIPSNSHMQQQSDFPIDPKVQQNKTSKCQELEPQIFKKNPRDDNLTF